VRLLAVGALAAVAAGCAGGTGAAATGGTGAPPSSTLPVSGTVTYTDGRIYTVAPRGATLKIPGIAVRVVGIRWAPSVAGAQRPPGTRTFAIVTVTATNRTHAPQLLAATQIWLLDPNRRAYLAAARARIPHPLVGATLPPGVGVTGNLVYAAPGRTTGNLLVYTFADATAIAKAHHVGLIAYG
jgi:hypothetical protein